MNAVFIDSSHANKPILLRRILVRYVSVETNFYRQVHIEAVLDMDQI